jgi:hypothetical protein
MPRLWSTAKEVLYAAGQCDVVSFCNLNKLPVPDVVLWEKVDWKVSACAYYRPNTEAMRKWTSPGINICLQECARSAREEDVRNWNWPGNVTDREPYGVICHELGHHVDWCTGTKKWTYGSEYSSEVMTESGEPPITSYAPNPAEWFAEIFRLFVTNPDLLRQLRPKAFEILTRKYQPLERGNWRTLLGTNVPEKIVKNLIKKGAKE